MKEYNVTFVSYWNSNDEKEYRGTITINANSLCEALELALADKRCPAMDYLTNAEAIVNPVDTDDGDYSVTFSVSNTRLISEVESMEK